MLTITGNAQPIDGSASFYRKNRVKEAVKYSFGTKEGEVDRSTKEWISTTRFDSLGNVVYFKGKEEPELENFYNFNHDIRDELNLDWHSVLVYKMEYVKDTCLYKTAVFNDKGMYVAKIEHFATPNSIVDSVYVYNALCYVKRIDYDSLGRKSLEVIHDNLYTSDLSLKSRSSWKYSTIDEHTVRINYDDEYRDIFDPTQSKYRSVSSQFDRKYNDAGRIIYQIDESGHDEYFSTYNKDGFKIEYIHKNTNPDSIFKGSKRFTTTYYNNNLIRSKSVYSDMAILTSYSEYEYKYYE